MPYLKNIKKPHNHFLIQFPGEVDNAGRPIFRCARNFKFGGCPFSTKSVEIKDSINAPELEMAT